MIGTRYAAMAAALLVVAATAACSGSAPPGLAQSVAAASPALTPAPAHSEHAGRGSNVEPECLGSDQTFVVMAAGRADLRRYVKGRSDLVGMSLQQVRRDAKAHEQSVRVMSVDGSCEDRTDDLHSKRINVYLRDGRVVWAALF